MAPVIVRLTIGFLASIAAMTVIIVVIERSKAKMPVWAIIGFMIFQLSFSIVAGGLSVYLLLPILLHKDWLPADNNDAYHVAYVAGAILYVFGMWGGNILLQLYCNALRLVLGMPLEKVELYRKKK